MKERKNRPGELACTDKNLAKSENKQKTGDVMNVVSFSNNGPVRFQSEEVVVKAYQCLDHHPHFRGRLLNIQIRHEESVLMLEGQLPSYYLKQILQSVLRQLDGVSEIQNDVEVYNPTDPSIF